MQVYPWQQQQLQELQQMQQDDRLPHALMLSGIAGMGKLNFANNFLQSLHCTSSNKPCGVCDSCKQFAAGTHPAHFVLQPKSGNANILIEQVRELKQWLIHAVPNYEYKTIVVNAMDNINLAACNALLKFLEEPPGKVCFVLLDNKQKDILPTILSRVQVLDFANLGQQQMQGFLQNKCSDAEQRLACYSWYEVGPLRLLELDVTELVTARNQILQLLLQLRHKQQDAVAVAEELHKGDLALYSHIWSSLLLDVAALHAALGDNVLAHKDVAIKLHELQQYVTLDFIAKFVTELEEFNVALHGAHNLDKTLLLANLLLTWQGE